MSRLDHANAFALLTMSVSRDNHAVERSGPELFERRGHGSRGLTCADDHGPPRRLIRQEGTYDIGRTAGLHSVMEAIEQKLLRIHEHHFSNAGSQRVSCGR